MGFQAVKTELKNVLIDTFNLLAFRISRERILNFGRLHLAFGLFCTVIVGIGRFWDHSDAAFPQRLGFGSVVYVFFLSFFLAIVIAPLMPEDWSLFRVLTFVSLVSPPAAFYAIPVERIFELGTANLINAGFLLIVSTWRVSLLVYFLRHFARLKPSSIFAATVLPITFIVLLILFTGFGATVLGSMGGFRERTADDLTNGILGLTLVISIFVFPISLISYLWIVIRNARSGWVRPDQ